MEISEQDRLTEITRNFTSRLYHRVCQSIYEKDKLLFTMVLCIRILEGEGCLDKPLFDFFIQGPPPFDDIDLQSFSLGDDEGEESKRPGTTSSRPTTTETRPFSHEEERPHEGEDNHEMQILDTIKGKCPWMTEDIFAGLLSLQKIRPFSSPPIL